MTLARVGLKVQVIDQSQGVRVRGKEYWLTAETIHFYCHVMRHAATPAAAAEYSACGRANAVTRSV